jgi:hypothetical protein
MAIAGRSAASKLVVAAGSSEPCSSDTVGVRKTTVRLKLTATLPVGLLSKALASAQQVTSTPRATGDASQGKASWWGAIAALFSGAIISAVSLITITGSRIEVAVLAVTPAPVIEQPVTISVEDVPFTLPPEPDSTVVDPERLVEREDGPVLESDFEKELDRQLQPLPRESRGHYLNYANMKNLDEKDLYQLHTILENNNFPLWEVDARAQMMNNEKRDYRPLFEGLGRIFMDEATPPVVEGPTPKEYSDALGLPGEIGQALEHDVTAALPLPLKMVADRGIDYVKSTVVDNWGDPSATYEKFRSDILDAYDSVRYGHTALGSEEAPRTTLEAFTNAPRRNLNEYIKTFGANEEECNSFINQLDSRRLEFGADLKKYQFEYDRWDWCPQSKPEHMPNEVYQHLKDCEELKKEALNNVVKTKYALQDTNRSLWAYGKRLEMVKRYGTGRD